MKHDSEFRKLRLRQLDRAFLAYAGARQNPRPRSGWLSAIREARGITLREVGSILAVTPQAVMKLQQSEASESITLKRLREVAQALDCDLVYALVPKKGHLTDLIEERARKDAAHRVISAEHTMMLEDQSSGDVDQRIKEEQSFHK